MEKTRTNFTLLFVPQFEWFQILLKKVTVETNDRGESLSNYLVGLAIKDFDKKGLVSPEEKEAWKLTDKKSKKTKSSNVEGIKRRFSLYMPKAIPWFYDKLLQATENRSTYIWDLMLQDYRSSLTIEEKREWIQYCTKFNRTTAMTAKPAKKNVA